MGAVTVLDEMRHLGVLLGAAVGDSLGVTWEFEPASAIPPGRFAMVGGGPFRFAPGAASDDTDLLHAALTAYPERGRFEEDAAVRAMLAWVKRGPPDVGNQTRVALGDWARGRRPAANEDAQGNGGVMRAAAHALACDDPAAAAENAQRDTLLTHPSRQAANASGFYAAVLWWTLRGAEPARAMEEAGRVGPSWAPYAEPRREMGGWCVHSLRLGLWALTHADSYETGVDAVIRTGGDTDTNAIVAGALLGARFGLDAVPSDWVDALEAENRARLLGEWDRLRPAGG